MDKDVRADAKEGYDEGVQNVCMISFVLKLKEIQRIDGDAIWSCLSSIIIMEVCRQMGLCVERNE